MAKVLVVDADEMVRFSLAQVLEHHGFDTTVAASVPEALRYISSNSYQVPRTRPRYAK